MASNHIQEVEQRRPLRLWPGVAAAALQVALWAIAPIVFDEGVLIAAGGSAALGLLVLVWWLFFSRAVWLERVAAVALTVAVVWATYPMVHASVSNGMMGAMLPIYAVAPLCVALAGWACISHTLDGALRLPAMAVTRARRRSREASARWAGWRVRHAGTLRDRRR